MSAQVATASAAAASIPTPVWKITSVVKATEAMSWAEGVAMPAAARAAIATVVKVIGSAALLN